MKFSRLPMNIPKVISVAGFWAFELNLTLISQPTHGPQRHLCLLLPTFTSKLFYCTDSLMEKTLTIYIYKIFISCFLFFSFFVCFFTKSNTCFDPYIALQSRDVLYLEEQTPLFFFPS